MCFSQAGMSLARTSLASAPWLLSHDHRFNYLFMSQTSLTHHYALYAELYKRKGDLSKAKEKLNKAIEIFRECGAEGWVGRCEKELALNLKIHISRFAAFLLMVTQTNLMRTD